MYPNEPLSIGFGQQSRSLVLCWKWHGFWHRKG